MSIRIVNFVCVETTASKQKKTGI